MRLDTRTGLSLLLRFALWIKNKDHWKTVEKLWQCLPYFCYCAWLRQYSPTIQMINRWRIFYCRKENSRHFIWKVMNKMSWGHLIFMDHFTLIKIQHSLVLPIVRLTVFASMEKEDSILIKNWKLIENQWKDCQRKIIFLKEFPLKKKLKPTIRKTRNLLFVLSKNPNFFLKN